MNKRAWRVQYNFYLVLRAHHKKTVQRLALVTHYGPKLTCRPVGRGPWSLFTRSASCLLIFVYPGLRDIRELIRYSAVGGKSRNLLLQQDKQGVKHSFYIFLESRCRFDGACCKYVSIRAVWDYNLEMFIVSCKSSIRYICWDGSYSLCINHSVSLPFSRLIIVVNLIIV